MEKGPKNRHRTYWFLAGAVAVILLFLVWVYSGPLTEAKQKVFQILPLPMALVNGRPIPASDLIFRFNVAEQSGGSENSAEVKAFVHKQLIKEEEISQLARAHDVGVSQKQIDNEYEALVHDKVLQNLLASNLGINAGKVKNSLIKPVLVQNGLKLWFNSQQKLNEQQYKLAGSLLERINKDSGLMSDLASQFSQDTAGGSAKGDMGFVQITDISPELRQSLSSMKTGEVKIIPGLKGIYIFRLEEQLGNKLHFREIFLNPSDFNVWLTGEFTKFRVINLVKL